MKPYALAVVCVISAAVAAAAQTEIAKASVPGIVNFGYLGKTVACAGATAPAALTEVKKLGYASVINLRVATEPGAEIDASAAAAQAAGLRFIHLPFNASSPDPMLVDKWDADRAATEATALGMTSAALKTYAIEQAQARRSSR